MSSASRAATARNTTAKPIEVTAELKALLRRLKLGRLLDTLPERLALARGEHLPHHDFLEMLLADEVARRDRQSALVRAKTAHLEPGKHLDVWDESTKVTYDRQLWAELTSLRFLADSCNVLVMGPVGVAPGRAVHPRRPCPASAGCVADQRLLPADRGTSPGSLHHHHLQPGTARDPRHDGRPAAGPVRDRPVPVRRVRARHRSRELTATTEAHHRHPPRPGRRQPELAFSTSWTTINTRPATVGPR
ncbi:hypothetical protein ATK30_0177 [Amycolatopsis echigonensis]|uniref:IstB-like ATP-binding domain-containing protein n=1 Tax=Amycolatopsis echigonensis TaxID=2576905 RepID=A0A2N3X1V3_9PSEU|nr:hypothetical protein ATK30_0177 [Amycolatopsis niigatensis]